MAVQEVLELEHASQLLLLVVVLEDVDLGGEDQRLGVFVLEFELMAYVPELWRQKDVDDELPMVIVLLFEDLKKVAFSLIGRDEVANKHTHHAFLHVLAYAEHLQLLVEVLFMSQDFLRVVYG